MPFGTLLVLSLELVRQTPGRDVKPSQPGITGKVHITVDKGLPRPVPICFSAKFGTIVTDSTFELGNI
jgi:hypothetical protein